MTVFKRLLALLVLASVFFVTASLGGLVNLLVRELPPDARTSLYWLLGAVGVGVVTAGALRARRRLPGK